MATAPTLTQIQQGGVPATVSDIVNAIQGQYTGVPVPTGGTSYGAARFLGSSPISSGTGTPTGTVAGTVPSWFAPGAFDINAFKAAPNLPQLNEQIATGTVYGGGGGDSSSIEPSTVSGDIYSSLFNPMPSWLPTVAGLLVPGAGMLLNAAEGYAQNQASEALKSALTAYGVENMPEASNPVWSAILGVFNADTDATKFAKSLAQSFQTPESLFGYYDASVNSSVSPIINYILNESGANVSANQLGYLGNAVAGYVQGEIASGKNLNDAFLSVAQQFGMNPQDAAAYAVNAVIDAAAKDTIYGVPVDEAAKQLAADPLGLFISNLGLLGVDTKALEVQAGLRPSDAQQALMDQIAALESGFTNQLNVQGEQFQTLLTQYQEAGLSADQALQQTINDLSSNVGAQINTQSEQFQTLLNQYRELGMTENEALRQTIGDLQTGLTGQINTQSDQFQTLLSQYRELGLTENEALRQTIGDLQTGLTGQINTQSEQFQTLLNQYREFGMTENEALQQTMSAMQTNLQNQLASLGQTSQNQFDILAQQYQDLGFSQQESLSKAIADLTGQIGQQSQQFNTLLDQYQQVGLTADEALRQTIADMQIGLTGQINTQGQQFQTLLNQYQQVGLTADQALQRTIADMQAGLTNQINTQGQQFQTLLNQYQELGMTADQALQQTIADMQTNQNVINNDLLNRINEGFNTDPGTATPTPVPTPELAIPTPLPPATGDSGGDYDNVGFGTDPGTATTSPVADNAPQPGTPLGPATGDSGGGGYDYSGAGDTGMATNSSGQTVSNDASIAAQDRESFGDSDSGGGGGGDSGRYCCSRMVHHGLWNVNYEFARLTVWSRKQPRWWRSGYPVWGKIIAKHLLGKVGFWTDVMQAFYDNKVRNKPRTWKSTLGELVIFPGSFVCGMIWREVPQGARLADPKEFA